MPEEAKQETEDEEPKFHYCDACGIQMKDEEDFCKHDCGEKWCKDCCKEDGNHKSREEVKERVKEIINGHDAYSVMGERVQDAEELDKMAEEYMKKLPAWEDKNKKEED